MKDFHSLAAILAIGDELTLGQKLDTNSAWIARQLADRGVIVAEHVTIADDLAQHTLALARLAAAYPLVVSTGGLGPTLDDLTRRALAAVMREELVEDAGAVEHIRAVMAKRGRELTDLQRTQALRPKSASMLENPFGTAPGIRAMLPAHRTADSLENSVAGRGAHQSCDVLCLPGPPGEMRPMFARFVLPALRTAPGRAVRTRVLHCLGIGEGDLAMRLGPLMERTRNPLVGTTASGGIVSIRIRHADAEAEPTSAKPRVVSSTPDALEAALALCGEGAGPFLFGEDDDTIEAVVLGLLRERAEKLVVAESCTGGGLGELFTRTPGSSDAFVGGWTVYADEMKTMLLGVAADGIARHGAVSERVARAMAEGALAAAPSAHHALAITGVAGPGESEGKAPGAVFIACASAGASTEVRRFLISGDRADVRDRAAKLALAMLRWRLIGADVPRCLWQMRLDGSPF